MVRVLDESLADMPVEEDEYSNNTSDEDNDEISNGEVYHKDEIPSEDSYYSKVHPQSTTLSQLIVYNLRGGNRGCDYSHRFSMKRN